MDTGAKVLEKGINIIWHDKGVQRLNIGISRKARFGI
jgi:hypothetical protein